MRWPSCCTPLIPSAQWTSCRLRFATAGLRQFTCAELWDLLEVHEDENQVPSRQSAVPRRHPQPTRSAELSACAAGTCWLPKSALAKERIVRGAALAAQHGSQQTANAVTVSSRIREPAMGRLLWSLEEQEKRCAPAPAATHVAPRGNARQSSFYLVQSDAPNRRISPQFSAAWFSKSSSWCGGHDV